MTNRPSRVFFCSLNDLNQLFESSFSLRGYQSIPQLFGNLNGRRQCWWCLGNLAPSEPPHEVSSDGSLWLYHEQRTSSWTLWSEDQYPICIIHRSSKWKEGKRKKENTNFPFLFSFLTTQLHSYSHLLIYGLSLEMKAQTRSHHDRHLRLSRLLIFLLYHRLKEKNLYTLKHIL